MTCQEAAPRHRPPGLRHETAQIALPPQHRLLKTIHRRHHSNARVSKRCSCTRSNPKSHSKSSHHSIKAIEGVIGGVRGGSTPGRRIWAPKQGFTALGIPRNPTPTLLCANRRPPARRNRSAAAACFPAAAKMPAHLRTRSPTRPGFYTHAAQGDGPLSADRPQVREAAVGRLSPQNTCGFIRSLVTSLIVCQCLQPTRSLCNFCLSNLQGQQTLEIDVEQSSLLPAVKSGKGSGGGGGDDAEAVDWIMTSLLFVFPAIGGLLFGCGAATATVSSGSHANAAVPADQHWLARRPWCQPALCRSLQHITQSSLPPFPPFCGHAGTTLEQQVALWCP